MFNEWKVTLLLLTSVLAYERPNRALSILPAKSYNTPIFVSKNLRRLRSRQSRVLFLDEEESRQPYGRGEIDLTQYNSKIKFDDSSDYDFTSPDDSMESTKVDYDNPPSGNERFFEPLSSRFRNSYILPQYYKGRFGRPYAPFEPYYLPAPYAPALRNSLYNPNQGWKARSPRVVFPYQEPANSLVQTNSHAGPGTFNENIVFREQNFGLGDVGADDSTLQDLETGSDAFAERDAIVPHRAHDLLKRMDIQTKLHIENSKYIPLTKLREPKPMFIQTDGSKILPPDLDKSVYYEFTNLTKEIGGKDAVLPKFKPISDAQIIRISEILNRLPMKSTKTDVPLQSTKRGRRGKILTDSTNNNQSLEVVTEKTETQDRQDEKSCPQGGTCEFFIYCWMVGGLLEGTCGGVLKGCCHRVAKAGILGVQDSNSIEYGSNELSYGPVINDLSKCLTELDVARMARHR